MNKPDPERPNRVVTCQICRVQMPQRYLAKHMQTYHPSVPETESEPSGVLTCPVCETSVSENEFAHHMQTLHSNWCPLCHARPNDLAEHLRSKHQLKPIQPPPAYVPDWKRQKRFICLRCKKKVSCWSYPKHERPHGSALRGKAQPSTTH